MNPSCNLWRRSPLNINIYGWNWKCHTPSFRAVGRRESRWKIHRVLIHLPHINYGARTLCRYTMKNSETQNTPSKRTGNLEISRHRNQVFRNLYFMFLEITACAPLCGISSALYSAVQNKSLLSRPDARHILYTVLLLRARALHIPRMIIAREIWKHVRS